MRRFFSQVPVIAFAAVLVACGKSSSRADKIFAEVDRLEAQAALSSSLEAYRLYNDALSELQEIPPPGFMSTAGEIIETKKKETGSTLRRLIAQARDGAFSDAATKGDIKMLGRLLDEGCHPNGGLPAPAVQCAIEAGQLEAVKFLLQRKADPYITHNILNIAVEHWHPDVVRFLYEQTRAGDCNLLRVAIERDDLALVKLIAGNHPEFVSQPCGTVGNTPLWEAARKGDGEIVKALLAKAGPVNSQAYRAGNHTTPLEIAAQSGRSNVVDILKAAGETD